MSLTKAYAINPHDDDRHENDYYPTAPVATFTLIRHCPPPEGRIWEPACGRGWISRELIRCGHSVLSSDLYPYEKHFPEIDPRFGHDFMDDVPEWVPGDVSAIITNPPFRRDLARRFAEKALDIGVPYVAMFCRLQFMETEKRRILFERIPPSEVLIVGRIHCTENDLLTENYLGGMVPYAWYVWRSDRAGSSSQTILRWANMKTELEEWKTQTGIISKKKTVNSLFSTG